MIKLAHQSTADDLQCWHREMRKQYERFYPSKASEILRISPWILLGFILVYFAQLVPMYLELNFHVELFIFSVAVFFLSLVGRWLWHKQSGLEKWCINRAGLHEWAISPEGVTFFATDSRAFYAWDEIVALQETENCWYLFLSNFRAIPIPKSAEIIEGNAEVNALIKCYWKQHPNNLDQDLPDKLYRGLLAKRYVKSFVQNFFAGLKLIFLCKVQVREFRVSQGQFIGLVIYQIVLFALFDYSENKVFNLYGLTEYSAVLLLFMLAGSVIASSAANPRSLMQLWVLILASTVVIETIYFALDRALFSFSFYGTEEATAVWALQVLWIAIAVWRLLRMLYGMPYPKTLHLLGIYVYFAFFLAASLTQQRFFIEDYRSDSYVEEQPTLNVEDTFYSQSHLVANALSEIKPEREGLIDMYFVGFAGQADEKVFANEVRYAQTLFDQQFDTSGRSLALLNSKDSVSTIPLANGHNLAAVLTGLSEKMNLEEDILFLFLSSHGSSDFNLSVSFWPLTLSNLSASSLKSLLDQSGIKNRVIVISACYSGGFIDVLKDENSLILTAARKDRMSFGCGADSDYTYFSNAFFIQELKERQSFMDAFEKSKIRISAREKVEQPDSESSLPQAYEGQAIKVKLDQFFNRLQHD